MGIPACLHIAWRHYLSEAYRRAGDADLAAHELVVAVEVGQIFAMPAGGQVGEIRVPVEQVKRRIFLAQQVIVDDIAPDQILPAQQVERRRHEAPIEIALALGKRRSAEHTSDLQSLKRISYAVF